MPVSIPSCGSASAGSCGTPANNFSSWENFFCLPCGGSSVCDSTPCIPNAALCGFGFTVPAPFNSGPVVGEYASQGTVSVQGVPNFGFGTGQTWTNPSNIANDNGSYATVVLDPNNANSPMGGQFSQYVVLQNLGFSLPSSLWIIGFAIAAKGHVDNVNCGVSIFNDVIISGTGGGTWYYSGDPNGVFGVTPSYPAASYAGSGQAMLCCVGCNTPNGETMFTSDTVIGDPSWSGGNPSVCQFEDDGMGGYFINVGTAAPLHQPTLWSAAEINSVNFGVAASFICRAGSNWSGQAPVTLSLTGLAIAVYYIGGATFCGGMSSQAVGNPLLKGTAKSVKG